MRCRRTGRRRRGGTSSGGRKRKEDKERVKRDGGVDETGLSVAGLSAERTTHCTALILEI